MIAALGGQGGGVVANWLVDVARREHHVVQATSVPGVAQRTGATSYYLEFFPESDLPADGRRPVMALMPSPGDVDIVLASEALEAARAVQRGFVTADRTTLIASTHRVFTISEKSALGDGRVDLEQLEVEILQHAKRHVSFDMAVIAERSGALISAVLLGALAGAGGLTFAEESYREVIRSTGKAVAANLAAFDAGLAGARSAVAASGAPGRAPSASHGATPQTGPPPLPDALRARIHADFPARLHELLQLGAARVLDYQDPAYATEYLDRIAAILALESDPAGECRLTRETAQRLALWMTFEDTIRVADLKTRRDRQARIRAEIRARNDQVVTVTEFLKPRVDEICGTLPARIGAALMASPSWRRRLARLTGDRAVNTSSISGFAMLRAVAALKRWRRGTLRFQQERARTVDWLARIERHAVRDYALAVEVAASQQLVKGYGDTHARGWANFSTLLEVAERLEAREEGAARLRRLREAALADEHGEAFGRELATLHATPG
jgi:indolepyruvate ferredoxin oxidoreductase beta subunit